MSLRPARNMSFGRWLLVVCFSSVKNRNVSGPHLFPSVTTHAKKSLCLPRTVLHRAKKSLYNRSQFRTLFLPHRFIKIRPSHQRPVSVEFLTICRIPGSPNLSKIKKVAENRDFDGKETLIVKRTIAISEFWDELYAIAVSLPSTANVFLITKQPRDKNSEPCQIMRIMRCQHNNCWTRTTLTGFSIKSPQCTNSKGCFK